MNFFVQDSSKFIFSGRDSKMLVKIDQVTESGFFFQCIDIFSNMATMNFLTHLLTGSATTFIGNIS